MPSPRIPDPRQSRERSRRRRQGTLDRHRDGHPFRYAETDGGTRRVDAPHAAREDAAPALRHRCVSGDPPVSGWQRASLPHPDDAAAPAPDWQPWTVCFLRALRQQRRRLEKKLDRELIVMGRLPGLSLQIVVAVTEHTRVTISGIVSLTGANRNTVKQHLASLVKAHRLAQHGIGKGTWCGMTLEPRPSALARRHAGPHLDAAEERARG
jgi:hypothetical protein